uniref:NADH dehydrogenase subunit 6 n=1 Tax=Knipowitschia caucasica TaxID=637954 RepID=A0AAV2K7Q0_KNICA
MVEMEEVVEGFVVLWGCFGVVVGGGVVWVGGVGGGLVWGLVLLVFVLGGGGLVRMGGCWGVGVWGRLCLWFVGWGGGGSLLLMFGLWGWMGMGGVVML